MKKRKAVILFGTLIAMLLGYVGWSWRIYLLPPVILWDDSVTRDDRDEVKRWIRQHPEEYEFRPVWSWEGARERLLHPYDGKREQVMVMREGDNYLLRSAWRGFVVYVKLREEEGAWQGEVLTWEQSEEVERRRMEKR